MSTTINDKISERIDQLLEDAEEAKKTRQYDAKSYLGYSAFYQWKANSETLILTVAGDKSAHYKDFTSLISSPIADHVDVGIGILNALKSDLESGFLQQVKDLVVAEVFTDFLSMAEHLLDTGYKDPAAFLIGAVLEDGLRKIAEKNVITVKSGDDIASLNTKLADQGVYNRLVQRQIQAWKAIRDSAAHGKFDEYTTNDVKSILDGVSRFLADII